MHPGVRREDRQDGTVMGLIDEENIKRQNSQKNKRATKRMSQRGKDGHHTDSDHALCFVSLLITKTTLQGKKTVYSHFRLGSFEYFTQALTARARDSDQGTGAPKFT